MRDGHQGSAVSERGRSVKDLKLCFPVEGYGQALMLMRTNKRKPEWVEWTIICNGETLPWNRACLLCFQSGRQSGDGFEDDELREENVCEGERHRILLIWLCAKPKHCSVLYLLLCGLFQRTFVHVISTLTLQKANRRRSEHTEKSLMAVSTF